MVLYRLPKYGKLFDKDHEVLYLAVYLTRDHRNGWLS